LAIPQYNEIKYAELILANGFQTQYYKYELKVLAKYWKSIGVKPKKRKELLYEFCQKNINSFEREIHYKMINSVLAYSNKKTSVPIVISSIAVYKHEFEILNNLPIQDYQKKLLFALLVEKKIKKTLSNIMNGTHGNEENISPYINISKKLGRSLIESAKIPSKYKINIILHELSQLNYITIMERELVKLDFIKMLSDVKSEKILDITTFDQSGYYFDLLNEDKKISFCEDCASIIKRKANNQKRCNDCNNTHRKAYINEKVKEHNRKIKHSETVT